MRRFIALAIIAALALPALASAHGDVPTKTRVIERIYPDLYHRELSRPHPSWNRLDRMAESRWHRQHPCSRDTLTHTWKTRGYWPAVEATWKCDHVSRWKVRFLRCIPAHEGGYTYPDVIYGGQRATLIGIRALRAKGNIVLGPWQVRPGWVDGHMQTGGTAYGSDEWTEELVEYAINPVNMARIVEGIGTSAYATASMC